MWETKAGCDSAHFRRRQRVQLRTGLSLRLLGGTTRGVCTSALISNAGIVIQLLIDLMREQVELWC
jgi:hypothetical protein